MSVHDILGRAVATSQQGFSITGYLLSVVTAGVVTTAMLPAIHDTVDTADRNALAYARGALLSAVQINHLVSQIRGGNQIEIDGEPVPLRFGYPFATADSLRNFATLEGFDIDELNKQARVWSPGGGYCFYYEEPKAPTGPKSRPVLSDIMKKTEGECA